jgi:hypothetical protein
LARSGYETPIDNEKPPVKAGREEITQLFSIHENLP